MMYAKSFSLLLMLMIDLIYSIRTFDIYKKLLLKSHLKLYSIASNVLKCSQLSSLLLPIIAIVPKKDLSRNKNNSCKVHT